MLKFTVTLLLVAMATCQQHGDLLAPDATTDAMPMVSGSAVPVTTEGSTAAPMMPDTSTGAMMTDTTMAPMTTSEAVTTMIPDVTTGPVTGTTGTDAPPTTAMLTTTAAPNYYPSIDEIVLAFKAIAVSEYFKKLSYDDQMLVLEMTSGGEVGKIKEVMDNIGYERIFNFIYNIPLKYLDTLMQFILVSLERENLLVAAANAS